MTPRSRMLTFVLPLVVLLVWAGRASAQEAQVLVPRAESWKVTVYPVLVWLPIYGADIQLPPPPDGGGGQGGGTDYSWNSGLFFGAQVEHKRWRIEADGMWLFLSGNRPERPRLDVDVDGEYLHATGGFRVGRNFYALGGVRRLGVRFHVTVDQSATFSRDPSFWDPLVGVAWHREAGRWILHAAVEGGGFGVGTDVEVFGAVRADWRVGHFGLTLGYTGWYFKITDTVANQTFRAKETLHGPIGGLGLYF